MKKVCLIVLFVLLLPVTSSFALSLTETGQQIFIPYATVGDGWWSGVAIHNTSASAMNFSIGVYTDTGTWVGGSSFSVPARAMEVQVLEYFFSGTPPADRMSPVIRTTANVTFQATLFVGSPDGGFGFQNYTSWDWVHPIFVGPILPGHWWEDLPLKPIVIPRLPLTPLL